MSKKDLLLIAIFTFLVLTLWAFFNITGKVQRTQITEGVQKEITPLPSTIDSEILRKLPERIQ